MTKTSTLNAVDAVSRSESTETWRPTHLTITVSCSPQGVIDFNRYDLVARWFREVLPPQIWASELNGWHGEPDAFIALKYNVEVTCTKDTEPTND